MTLGRRFPSVLAAAKKGDDGAVAELFHELNPRLMRYLSAQAPEVAEDLAAEVWMAVARGLPSFEGDEPSFRGWIFAIARRQVWHHWRWTDRRRFESVPLEELARRPATDDPTVGAESEDAVRALMAHLPPEHAEILLLRVVAGLDVDEVARIVGKRPGTVRVIQHRALQRMARRLPRKAMTG